MLTGKVVAVNISEKKGQIKHSVDSVEFREDYGIVGDAHAGPGLRQVSLLDTSSVKKMEELGVSGLCSGKFAENITTEGLLLYHIPVGTRVEIGETLNEVTQIGKKCHAADGCEIARTVGKCIMPTEGIFVKVIRGGIVRAGDIIRVLEDR